MAQIENDNLENSFISSIYDMARSMKQEYKLGMNEEEEINNTDDAQDPVAIPDLKDFKELP